MKKLLTFLSVMFLFNINVSAASLCDYDEQIELNSKAANVKVSYDIVDKTIHFEDMDSIQRVFNIQILNVTEEFYIVVKNDITKVDKTYYSTDAQNGMITFEWDYAEAVTNFTIQVYTTANTNCANEKYKTIYLTTPRYNEYYNTLYCDFLTDFYLCQEFVTFDKISREEFVNKIDSYENKIIDNNGEEIPNDETPTIMDKIVDFIDNNKWYILGGVSLILIGVYCVHKIKVKKQRELGL